MKKPSKLCSYWQKVRRENVPTVKCLENGVFNRDIGEKKHTHVLDKTSQSSGFMILGRAYIKKVNGAFDSVTLQQFLEEIQLC